MQKRIADKKVVICICAAVAVIAAVVIVLLLNKEETFRSILVYEVEGTATIDRNGAGSMNAAENLYLESGDRVTVASDSSMRMKLDDDKYVMAEADTIFSVEAEGTDADSKTRICLEQGAITNEIQHPLSEESRYETFTPNSVMAVRGTIYRAEIYIDGNGDKNTKMCCFQGQVGTMPILPDGTYGEEILVSAGSELIIYSDGSVEGPRDIAYEELPAQALQNLKSMSENGQAITGMTLEELTELADQADGTADGEEEPAVSGLEQTALPDTETDSGQSDADEDIEAETVAAAARNTAKSASGQADRDVKSPETGQTAVDQPDQSGQKTQIPKETQPKVSEQTDSAGSGNDNTGGDGFQSGGSPQGGGSSQSGVSGGQSDNNKPDQDRPGSNTPVAPPPIITYTVTFEYQGTTFATQPVVSGRKVSVPVLAPAVNGEWDFDFESSITADTVIQWKE